MSYVRSAGQYWKLLLGLGVCAAASVVLFALLSLDRVSRRADHALFELGAVAVAVLAFTWTCLVVRCPGCGLRLLWYAVSKLPHSSWLTWVFQFTECPGCQQRWQSEGRAG
jgi:hypothetical protein